jgi:hypothetical protein
MIDDLFSRHLIVWNWMSEKYRLSLLLCGYPSHHLLKHTHTRTYITNI